ncbi:MAG TPA: hypothetical protein VF081_13320 [Solirubrobacterales bacterium]
MSHHLTHRTGTVLIAFVLGVVLMLLGGAAKAAAVQSGIYDEFAACPTDDPRLNGPPAEVAVCVSGTTREGTLELGNLSLPIDSPLHLQFAATSPPNPEIEDCAPLNCLPVVPGSTTLEGGSTVIWMGDSPRHGWGQKKSKWRKDKVRLTIESAGDAKRLAIEFLFGAPVPAYSLPVKVHLEGPFLGKECYIGSSSEPIVLNPMATNEPEKFDSQPDPNGLSAEFLKVFGFNFSDTNYAVPAVEGCGPRKRHRWDRSGEIVDWLVNRVLDLPAPAGTNEAALLGTDIAFAVASLDGTPPDGGATLQQAFEAAK